MLRLGFPLAALFSEDFAKSLPDFDFDLFEYVVVKATWVVCAVEFLRVFLYIGTLCCTCVE